MNRVDEILGYIVVTLTVMAIAAVKRHYDLKRIGRMVCVCPVCGCLHRARCCPPPTDTKEVEPK